MLGHYTTGPCCFAVPIARRNVAILPGWAGVKRRAGVPGLEPRLAEPESAGLPITPYPKGRGNYTGRSPRAQNGQPSRTQPGTVPGSRATTPESSTQRDPSGPMRSSPVTPNGSRGDLSRGVDADQRRRGHVHAAHAAARGSRERIPGRRPAGTASTCPCRTWRSRASHRRPSPAVSSAQYAPSPVTATPVRLAPGWGTATTGRPSAAGTGRCSSPRAGPRRSSPRCCHPRQRSARSATTEGPAGGRTSACRRRAPGSRCCRRDPPPRTTATNRARSPPPPRRPRRDRPGATHRPDRAG